MKNKKNIFQKEYILPNGDKVLEPKNYKMIYICVFLIVLYISIKITSFDIVVLFTRFDKFMEVIYDMIPPDFSYFNEIIGPLIQTIQMSIVGTFFGALFAFPVAFLAAKNTTINKFVLIVTKIILSLVRTMPVLIYAMIFTYMFGLGEFAGVVAITIFTFGILTKMTFEFIEGLDMGSFEAATASGVTKLNSIVVTMIPQMIKTYYSYILYTLEINVRSAAILGYVGAGGIGILLDETLGFRQYSKTGMIIFSLIITVMIIDGLAQQLRRRLK